MYNTLKEVKKKKYIASVTFEGKIQIIERDDYKTKKALAHDLRANGYRVRFISTPEKFDEDAEKYYWACEKTKVIHKAQYESKKRIINK